MMVQDVAARGPAIWDEAPVRTPDQRLRVFVSSTLQEMAAERAAARQAIAKLHLIPVLFELGARPYPPQRLYRSYLAQSHIFVGIYGERYGWIAPEMTVSGLEDEYLLATDMPRLIYIKRPAPQREAALERLLKRIQGDDALSYKPFATAEELAELIANDLAVLLSERFEQGWSQPGLSTEEPRPTPKGNLPLEVNRFIGREQQVAAVRGLFAQEGLRLATVTGPGGVGKTRLALRAAAGLADQFSDGVWLVDLAGQSDPSLVPQLAAGVLGAREQDGRSTIDSLIDHVTDRSLLLVLDNCEHLIDAAAGFAQHLLRAAPNVHILATSREPLGIAGEKVWPLPPMSVPNRQATAEPGALSQYEAVALFVDRAAAVRPQFELTGQNAAAVAEIATRLDGIPLAIELAAARTRLLPPEEIVARLDDRFRLLNGGRDAAPRQQTLQALIDWSHDLLTDKERVLLRRLAIFAGGWTMEAAEQVTADEQLQAGEVLDLLAQLVDKSLVVSESGSGRSRYRFLETIRQYAQRRLAESGEATVLTGRHAAYFLDLAEGSYDKLWGPEQCVWLARLEADRDNLWAALEWTAQAPERSELLLRLASTLWRFWEVRGHITEGRAWLERALANSDQAPSHLRARALRAAGCLARMHGDYAVARDRHSQSLALFEQLGSASGMARELEALGEIEQLQGAYQKATELHHASLALRREANDEEGIAASLRQLGIIARERGRNEEAEDLLEQSLRLTRALADTQAIALTLNHLGLIAHAKCEYGRAVALFEEALELARQLEDKLSIASTMQSLAHVAKDRGDFKRAIAWYEEGLAAKRELGDKAGIGQILAALAEIAFLQGDYLKSSELAQASLALAAELGSKRGTMIAQLIRAYVAIYQGDYAEAGAIGSAVLALAQDLDAQRAIAYAVKIFGLIAHAEGRADEAVAKLHETLAIFRRVDDHRNVAHTLVGLARAAYRAGDREAAAGYLAESLALSRRLDVRWSLAYSLEIMGLLRRHEGRRDEARELFRESLQLSAEQENRQGIANCLGALAGLAVTAGHSVCATHLFAAADKVREAVGAKMGREDGREYGDYLAQLRQQLDDRAFAAAWATGYTMTMHDAIAEALGAEDASGATICPPNWDAQIARRPFEGRENTYFAAAIPVPF